MKMIRKMKTSDVGRDGEGERSTAQPGLVRHVWKLSVLQCFKLDPCFFFFFFPGPEVAKMDGTEDSKMNDGNGGPRC